MGRAQMARQTSTGRKRKTTKKKGADGKACWKGYRYAGTKNGKDRCVPVKKKRKKK